ncbi:Clavaminate synthase-like protein [Durotheca rogersii]|uniref:Clavaminate synthase-like protein n=1 Tax=Durotheca rogersii TaxID=419775 RepID=UPI00221E6637|nr:Clavaminate synthase-like protein [Durotheca rogersii]KAI5865919.1 Clavaminate synthase-like protein [Durotheca rogersii]
MFRWPATLDASPIFSTNKFGSVSRLRDAFAAELVSHLRQYGFARVRNHGVAPSTIAALFRYQRDFFRLPLPAKLSVRHGGGASPARGYSPWAYEKTAILRPDLHALPALNTSKGNASLSAPRSNTPTGLDGTAPKTLLDAREQFAIGPPDDAEFPTPQLAEDLLPGFNGTARNAYIETRATCRALVAAIESGLGAPADSISDVAAGGAGAELNLNFYPEVERGALEAGDGDGVAMRRIWPHSDLGIVSALFPDGVGASGLELEVRVPLDSPAFAPLPIDAEGDVVLLVSDTLERWTNGYLRAAIHRVGLPPVAQRRDAALGPDGTARVPERRSAVMFFRPPPTADIGPLPHFVSAENPARYGHVTAGEYLKLHNEKLY